MSPAAPAGGNKTATCQGQGPTATVKQRLAASTTASGSVAAAGQSAAGSQTVASGAEWEPAFPGQQAGDGEQQQQQVERGGAAGHSSWAERGWSTVKL